MKGYVKRFKVKRMLAMLLAAVMVLTICMPQSVSAETPEKFKGGTNIKDLLTSYQYVVRGNADLNCHTVGSVMVGGELYTNNYIGDCAQAPSYAKHVIDGGVANVWEYLASTQAFYYGTSDLTDEVMANKKFTRFPEYVDVEKFFTGTNEIVSLIDQSKTLAKDNPGTTATSAFNTQLNKYTIDLDFSKDKVFTIDYAEFKKAEAINFINFNVDDLSVNEYLINIVNVNGTEITMDSECDYGQPESDKVDFLIDGKSANMFLQDLDGSMKSGVQCNLSGMKLIWNFPDATGSLKWSAMGGHLVAPQANVNVISGRFEGGIIANTVVSSGQAHFFPYGSYSISSGGDEITANDIVIQKLYLLSDGTKGNPVGAAKFALYEDAACTKLVAEAEVDNSTGLATFRAADANLECGKSYYVKETFAPDNYQIDKNTVYECAISVGGLVTYKEVSSGQSYSSTVPVFENLAPTYTDDSGTLKITVIDAETKDKIEGAKITVGYIKTDGTIEPVKTDLVTPESGSVILTELPKGSYQVQIKEVPDEYNEPEKKVVEVNVQETGYHTFELTKQKEKITVYIEDEAGNRLPGGYVEIKDSTTTERAHVGSDGMIVFADKTPDKYTITLVGIPAGYDYPADVDEVIDVNLTDAISNYEYIFELPQQTGTVKVDVLDVNGGTNVTSVSGCTVSITYPDKTTTKVQTDAGDGTTDGFVTFENVPVGDCVVKVETAPADYILIANSSDDPENKDSEKVITAVKNETVSTDLYVEKVVNKGNLIIKVVDTDSDSISDQEVTVTVKGPDNNVTNHIVKVDGAEVKLEDQPNGTYTVSIQTTNGLRTIEAIVDGEADTSSPNSVDADVAKTPDSDTNVVFTVEPFGALKVIVTEEGTGTPINGATVVIKQDDTVIKTVETVTEGQVIVEGLGVGDYTVEVTAVPEGYLEPTNTYPATVEQGTTKEVQVPLTKLGTIVVTVEEKDTDNRIAGADIKIVGKDTSYTQTLPVPESGQVTFSNLKPDEYIVTIIETETVKEWVVPTGTDAEKAAVIANGNKVELLYELEKETAELVVNVVDNETGNLVTGSGVGDKVVIVIKDENGNVVSAANTETMNGTITNTLPVGTYEVTLIEVPKAYLFPDGTSETAVHPDIIVEVTDGGETEFRLKKVDTTNLGSLEVNVYLKDTTPDDLSNNPVYEGAVTIQYKALNGSTSNETRTEITNPKLQKDNLPSGNYTTVLTIPDGYTLANVSGNTASQTKLVEAGPATVINYVLEAAGTVKITVREDNGTKIEGAEVVLKDPGTGETIKDVNGNPFKGTTNAEGVVTFEKVPEGNYIFEVEDVPEKYDPPTLTDTDKAVTVNKDTPAVKEVILKYKGKITVTVTEKGAPNVVIPNVKVTLLDSKGNVVMDNGSEVSGTTDSNGQYTFTDLPDGSYKVKIDTTNISSTYKAPAVTMQDAKIKDGAPVSKVFTVYGVGDLIITVVEVGTNAPIAGATVKVTDPENTVTVTQTDADGKILLQNQRAGEQTIVVTQTPDGYKVPTSLMSTAKVTVVKGYNQQNGNAVKQEFVVAPTANLTITVVDKDDQTPLANAQITVKDPYGNEVGKITDNNGNVELTDWIVGDSTITIVKVPQTNILPTPATTTKTVVKGDNVHKVEAPKVSGEKGDLTITVTDKETGKLVPGADVQIKDPSGVITTTKTDSDGKIVLKDIPVGDYTIIITGVPDGYTKPDKTPTSVSVVAGPNPPVNILIKKPVATDGENVSNPAPSTPSKSSNEIIRKAPKTGDTGYTPIALAMMVVSIVGLAGIVVYRKKTENER